MGGPTKQWLGIIYCFIFAMTIWSFQTNGFVYHSKAIPDKARDTPYENPINNKYCMIDIVGKQRGRQTGLCESDRESRILTTGKMNENFWHKLLGDDYKRAIHLYIIDKPFREYAMNYRFNPRHNQMHDNIIKSNNREIMDSDRRAYSQSRDPHIVNISIEMHKRPSDIRGSFRDKSTGRVKSNSIASPSNAEIREMFESGL